MLFRARWARKPTTTCGRSQPSLSTALAAPTANTLPVRRSTRVATMVAESTAADPDRQPGEPVEQATSALPEHGQHQRCRESETEQAEADEAQRHRSTATAAEGRGAKQGEDQRGRAGRDVEPEQETKPDRAPQPCKLRQAGAEASRQEPGPADGKEGADRDVEEAEQDPGALLQIDKNGADQGCQRPERPDEEGAGERERADLGDPGGGALTLDDLDQDHARADRARLDEAQQPKPERQGHQLEQVELAHAMDDALKPRFRTSAQSRASFTACSPQRIRAAKPSQRRPRILRPSVPPLRPPALP